MDLVAVLLPHVVGPRHRLILQHRGQVVPAILLGSAVRAGCVAVRRRGGSASDAAAQRQPTPQADGNALALPLLCADPVQAGTGLEHRGNHVRMRLMALQITTWAPDAQRCWRSALLFATSSTGTTLRRFVAHQWQLHCGELQKKTGKHAAVCTSICTTGAQASAAHIVGAATQRARTHRAVRALE